MSKKSHKIGQTPWAIPGRREASRAKAVYILIVCEGAKTEPNYFMSFGVGRRPEELHVEIEGMGYNTCSLVRYAMIKRQELEEAQQRPFDRVWVVFDKDDFADRDFNEAIRLAHESGMRAAWSNEAFELWFLLHFELPNSPQPRRNFAPMLEALIQSGHPKFNRKHRYKYKKNATNMRRLLMEAGGSLERAKRHARRLRSRFSDDNYALHNPCTTVDLLIEELEHPEAILAQRTLERYQASLELDQVSISGSKP